MALTVDHFFQQFHNHEHHKDREDAPEWYELDRRPIVENKNPKKEHPSWPLTSKR